MCYNYALFHAVLSSTYRCVCFWCTHGALDCEANNWGSNVSLPNVDHTRRAKLGQIQGGLQRAIQDSTKGGLQ